MKKIIIIGSGIVGISAAYHLAGKADVTVIDRKEVGRATDAAAGIVCPWIAQRRNKAWYALAKGGARYYRDVVAELMNEGERDTGYKRVGTLALHEDKKLNEMLERTTLRREEAPEIGELTRLSAEEAKVLFPPLSDEYDALLVEGGARVDGEKLRAALERVAVKRGVKLIDGSAVLVEEDGYHVECDGVRYDADEIILACGAWLPELLEPIGYTARVSGEKAQIVHVQLPNVDASDWPVVMPPRRRYLLGFEGGRVVIGSTHERGKAFDARPTAVGVHEVLAKGLESAPGLAEAELIETRVGFRPVTPNSIPILGRVPGAEKLLVANGLGSSGLTVGPFIGKVLGDLVLTGDCELDLSLYPIEDHVYRQLQ
ncbi:FAD-dependent oxidoreductase [Exiguobacterium sp. SH0S1]|uniref:NAD(P)/FAD-dependent oxidoreductase n=1 Tax=Exiguobacterium sp. SH0S1 TaxID=2510949 RepID=UPI00103AA1DC|nr:FAD-dependent oxidoreductase [Exiguobacterium sp. SH0S1]TCI80298.1 FAD-dependent oxidoreductase [Exiguobacterium sp. SH0S1]